mgnify:FL=1|jgi:hypothetical protein
MEGFSESSETTESYDIKENDKKEINKETLEKYDRLMEYDKLEEVNNPKELKEFTIEEIKEKLNELFSKGGLFNKEIEKTNDTDDNAEKQGLTEEQKNDIKKRTGWSDEIINSIGSMREAEIYIKAGLKEAEINGKKCLIRSDIDMDQKDEDGITNRERMERGLPPITKNGEKVELHHIGQKPDSPLAELTTEEHRGAGNDTILHDKQKESEIDRNEFAKERKEHWKNRAMS